FNFDYFARTHNQHQVAGVMDVTPDTNPVVLALFSAETEEQFQTWLDLLNGEVYTTYPIVGAAGVQSFRQALDGALGNKVAAEFRNGWITYYNNSHTVHGTSENAGFYAKTTGGVAGLDV